MSVGINLKSSEPKPNTFVLSKTNESIGESTLNETYKEKMKKMNKAFMSWLEEQSEENITAIWTPAMKV